MFVACDIGEYGEEKLVELFSKNQTIHTVSFSGLFPSLSFIINIQELFLSSLSQDLRPTSAFPARLFASLRTNKSLQSLSLRGLFPDSTLSYLMFMQ